MATVRKCAVENCLGKATTRGWCKSHYGRWLRHGDPNAGRTNEGAPMRFIHEVALVCDSDDCLTWPYSRNRDGRAKVWDGNRVVLAHRLICEAVHGEPPSPIYEASHSCGNGHLGCVNPRHLSWKTHQENMDDKAIHGTSPVGEFNPSAKLTESDVRQIRASTLSSTELARAFGVTRTNIIAVRNGASWSHVP